MPVRTVFYHALSAVADLVGYFCCPGNEIAMRVIIGQNDIRSLCAPCTGFTVENATILLAVPQAIVSSSTATPSTSPTGSSPGNQTSAASSNSTSANTYDPSPQHESNRNTIMVCGLGLAFALSAQYQACVS
ncbi:hypothetical protein Vi05172_g1662 [Venturia inaequalis]|nr:hypothetical protein Vi05172_g1662 [Venturia inaequalis]